MSNSKPIVKIKGKRFIIEDLNVAKTLHDKSGYGKLSNFGLELDCVEVAFLMERGKVITIDESGKEINFKEFIINIASKMDSNFWVKYLVYSDLRKRGYIVRPGYSVSEVEFLVKVKGEKIAEYMVHAVVEGKRISFNDLSQLIDKSLKFNKELIIAIVDKEGNISYYTLSKF